MLALTASPLKGGITGEHEMYMRGRFVTVTGNGGKGQVREATTALLDLDRRWFGDAKTAKQSTHDCADEAHASEHPEIAETAENIARLKDALSFISADRDYATWRNVIWSIMSSGWTCAETITREWSMTALHRYEADAFDKIVEKFNPSGGIGLGTLYYYAKQNGWTKPTETRWEQADPANATTTPFRLLTAEQVKAIPTAPYRVKGLLPAQGVAAIYGESGCGKSFIAIDMVMSIARARSEWFGMAIKPAPVAYVALEGRGGISKRLKAWEIHNGCAASDTIRFLLSDFTLTDRAGAERLGAEIVNQLGTGAVVVVDTLNQSAPGADENSSADMSRVLANAKILAESVEGLVILIHHAGKDRTKGMRGHSSLFAAMDAVMEVHGSATGRSWQTVKAKDDQGGISYEFELVPHVVGADEDGFDITSCAVRQTLNAPQVKRPPLSGKNQSAAMKRLRELFATSPGGISHKRAVEEVAAALGCAPGRKGFVAKETIDRLIANGHLVIDNGEVRLP